MPLYLWRKIRKPKFEAQLLQSNNSNNAFLYTGYTYFFGIQITPRNSQETLLNLDPIICDLFTAKNSLIFKHITLTARYLNKNEPPTYYLFFYCDLTDNLDYLTLRANTPLVTVLSNASSLICNKITPLDYACKTLTREDLTHITNLFYPSREKATHLQHRTHTWTLYTTNYYDEETIIDNLTQPLTITQTYNYRHYKISKHIFIAASDAIGSVSAKTRTPKGTICRIRYQQHPLMTWFTPTPTPLAVKGVPKRE